MQERSSFDVLESEILLLVAAMRKKQEEILVFCDGGCAVRAVGILDLFRRRIENLGPRPQYVHNPFDETDPAWKIWPADDPISPEMPETPWAV